MCLPNPYIALTRSTHEVDTISLRRPPVVTLGGDHTPANRLRRDSHELTTLVAAWTHQRPRNRCRRNRCSVFDIRSSSVGGVTFEKLSTHNAETDHLLIHRRAPGRDRDRSPGESPLHITQGIAGQQPATLKPLPAFSADELQEGISGGDICIQACSDDAQVALHAVRNLARLAEGAATVAWSQSGLGKSSTLARDGKTPRNLFGFKDGTANIRSNSDFDDFVWASSGDGPAWMAGGTYLVARKVEMILETWDNEDLTEQQEVFGRTKGTGAPLSGGSERTRPNFRATGANGEPMIDPHSHIALAAPGRAGRILRRGYNYEVAQRSRSRRAYAHRSNMWASHYSAKGSPQAGLLPQMGAGGRVIRLALIE